MTTTDLVGTFVDEAIWALKKNHRHQREGRMLDRHEPVEIGGYTYAYWKEFAVHATAEHIKDILPDAEVQVVLDGNDSSIELEIDEDEQRTLNSSLYVFLKKWGCL